MQLKLHNISRRYYYPFVISTILLICLASNINAQSLEPRAYSNAPIGMNFLLAGYQNSNGALLFDPPIPITNANANIDMGFLGYAHTLDIAGNLSKVAILLPYASLSANGFVENVFRTRETTGAADPSLFFSINFYGAPALPLDKFKNYNQDTIIGFTLKLTLPLGAYDTDKIINIGTNRWSFEPGIGVSKAIGNWTLETSAAATFYTNNNEFGTNKTRKQEPVYSTQFHVTYSFTNKVWVAVSTTYFTGGQTTVENIKNNDLLENWRTGFTLALPINRNSSIKLFGSKGVSTRTGTNYDAIGIVWQYHWNNEL
jgi:hypothetical protein